MQIDIAKKLGYANVYAQANGEASLSPADAAKLNAGGSVGGYRMSLVWIILLLLDIKPSVIQKIFMNGVYTEIYPSGGEVRDSSGKKVGVVNPANNGLGKYQIILDTSATNGMNGDYFFLILSFSSLSLK